MKYIRWFEEIGASDVGLVGGKGANLGEMIQAGLPVPPGFCLTAEAYRDFVRGGKDFPLSSFRSRNNPVTQAVGYGKAMMTFHMLRLKIGDELFTQGLRRLAETQRFKRASWGDVRQVFEATSGLDLSNFFAQWVTRVGAPELSLGEPRVTPMRSLRRSSILSSATGPSPRRSTRSPRRPGSRRPSWTAASRTHATCSARATCG